MLVIRDANIINRKESFDIFLAETFHSRTVIKKREYAFFIKKHSRTVMVRLIFPFFALYYSRTVMKKTVWR